MTKLKKTMLSVILAIAIAMTACFGLTAVSGIRASASDGTDEEPIRVWIITDNEKYDLDLANALEIDLSSKGNYAVSLFVTSNSQEQIDIISDSITKADVLYIFPIDSDSLAPILNEVYSKNPGIRIFIMGPINTSYPPNTVFILVDYFQLGVSYVEWILRDRGGYDNISDFPEFNVFILYGDNANGNEFMGGFDSATKSLCPSNWHNKFVASDSTDLGTFVSDCITYGAYEVVTYDGDIAEQILDLYLHAGYSYSSTGSGTGIRALPLESEDPDQPYIDDAASFSSSTVDDFVNGYYDDQQPNYCDFWVIDLPLAPARSEYVTK